jgi:hypothetical protein
MSSVDPESARPLATLSRAWRAAEPDDATVDRAYVRFLRRRPSQARPQAWQIARWVGVGMLLGMGSLYAATAKPWRKLGGDSQQPASSNASVPGKTDHVTSRHTPALVLVPAAPSSSASPAGEPRDNAAPRPDPAVAARESWQRAAQGLRERDFATAGEALRRLSEQGTKAERESAQLVRAQLLLSQGQTAEAFELATALATSAETASIRRKALALASEAGKSSASKRSFEPPTGTNLP